MSQGHDVSHSDDLWGIWVGKVAAETLARAGGALPWRDLVRAVIARHSEEFDKSTHPEKQLRVRILSSIPAECVSGEESHVRLVNRAVWWPLASWLSIIDEALDSAGGQLPWKHLVSKVVARYMELEPDSDTDVSQLRICVLARIPSEYLSCDDNIVRLRKEGFNAYVGERPESQSADTSRPKRIADWSRNPSETRAKRKKCVEDLVNQEDKRAKPNTFAERAGDQGDGQTKREKPVQVLENDPDKKAQKAKRETFEGERASLALVGDRAPLTAKWSYPLGDEQRRCFAGHLRGAFSAQEAEHVFQVVDEGTPWERTGPRWTRAARDPSCPTKPQPPFLIWSRKKRSKFEETLGASHTATVIAYTQRQWELLSEIKKEKLTATYVTEMEEWRAKMVEYRQARWHAVSKAAQQAAEEAGSQQHGAGETEDGSNDAKCRLFESCTDAELVAELSRRLKMDTACGIDTDVVVSLSAEASGERRPSLTGACPSDASACLGVQLPSLGTALFEEPDENFRQHLDVHGYAVLRGILGRRRRRREFLEAFWSAMTQVVPGTDPSQRSTWTFPKGYRGIVHNYGLPQADFAWMVRSAPTFRLAFERIFETPDLVVSLDAVVCESNVPKRRLNSWLHKDQRPECALLSVQAMYTFFGSGPEDAGTCVVPGSHRQTFDWERGAKRDFIKAPLDFGLEALKPHVPPDSAVFFNSRLVHASAYGTKPRADDDDTGLPLPSRLGVAVAYAPKSRRSEPTRYKKEEVYLSGGCTTHWPCDRLSVKPKPRFYELLPGARNLPSPPPLPERLALL